MTKILNNKIIQDNYEVEQIFLDLVGVDKIYLQVVWRIIGCLDVIVVDDDFVLFLGSYWRKLFIPDKVVWCISR